MKCQEMKYLKSQSISKKQPVETNAYEQNVYVIQGPSGKVRIVTSPVPKGSTIASMYHLK